MSLCPAACTMKGAAVLRVMAIVELSLHGHYCKELRNRAEAFT